MLDRVANAPYGVSAISLWELAKLVQKKRIRLVVPVSEWMDRALDPVFIQVIPLSSDIVVESTTLPGAFQSDPADEMIVATARIHQATLITRDDRMRAYDHVNTIWD